MPVEYFGMTEQGKRWKNEDAYYIDQQGPLSIFAVADGLGGHAAGDVASRLAVTALGETAARGATHRAPAAILREAFSRANTDIISYNRSRGLNAATTLVAAIVEPSGHCTIGTAGDSRATIASGEGVWHTKDHSYVQTLVDRGVLSEDEAFAHPQKHIVEKALGLHESVLPDIYEKDLQDTTLVLSTDGLHDTLRPRVIAEIAARLSPRDAAAHLVREALRQQSADNITVVVVRVT